MRTATAEARPNIALIKYWGKRDQALNLPAVGSLSITLDRLFTRTTVQFDASLAADDFLLDGSRDTARGERVSACLDLLRARAGVDWRARVQSENNFPTGAGLASSASGFAALVTAADAALGLNLPRTELAVLARRGSGSAARSLFGGFVEMALGERADGSDSTAHPLLEAADWPLEVVIAITSRAAKAIGSTAGMQRTAETSPFYDRWVEGNVADLRAASSAVGRRDFGALGELAEFSCLKMHALAMSARPGLVYWNGATVECLHRVRALRSEGVPVFFTIDAGPQVKAVTTPAHAAAVAAALGAVAGVGEVLRTGLGAGACVVEGP